MFLRGVNVVIFLLITGGVCFTQISFQKADDSILDLSNIVSGLPILVSDMNGDMLDDIVHLRGGNQLYIGLQKPDNTFRHKHITNIASSSQWSITAADFNMDTRPEIVVGGGTGARIISLNAHMEFEDIEFLEGTDFFVQTMSAGDFNNDGMVDLFLCNDVGTSIILKNDGGELKPLASPWIDFNTDPPSNNSGNYGSVYTDFDRDGDMDLYIAKCKAGVSDPQDPRRVNVLYERIGDSSYVERAAEYGLDLGAQSWTADFADFDLDADMDALVTQHNIPTQIFENRDGVFIDQTESAELNALETPLQGMFADFNNDLYPDILITGAEHGLFLNNQDGRVVQLPFGGEEEITSFAYGDLNSDGRLDVFSTYPIGFVEPSATEDALWLNTSGRQNYLQIHLEDRSGNTEAVGASAEIFGDFGSLYREVRAGESYGITNSTTLHFGLGIHDAVDSLRIHWPDQTTETFYDVSVNKLYYHARNSCLSTRRSLSSPVELCSGDTLSLTAPPSASYRWSTGAETRTIDVLQPGLYHLTLTDQDGCKSIAGPVVVKDPVTIDPHLQIPAGRSQCRSDSMAIESGSYEDPIRWSDGSENTEIIPFDSGFYYYDVLTQCGPVRSDSVFMNIHPSPAPEVMCDTLTSAGPATLIAEGGEVHWYEEQSDQHSIFKGDSLLINYIDSPETFYAESHYTFEGKDYRLGPDEHAGSKFHSPQYAGGLFFDVQSPIVLDSVAVYSDVTAPRVIKISSITEGVVYRDTFSIQPGRQSLALNAHLMKEGMYQISTDEDFNLEQFGSISPRLYRTENATNFPYSVDRLISIRESTGGPGYYYYFYDWKVSEAELDCTSDRVPVRVMFPSQTTDPVQFEEHFHLYPNPADENITVSRLNTHCASPGFIRLIDMTGVEQKRKEWPSSGEKSFSLEGISAGAYNLQLIFEDGSFTQTFLIVGK